MKTLMQVITDKLRRNCWGEVRLFNPAQKLSMLKEGETKAELHRQESIFGNQVYTEYAVKFTCSFIERNEDNKLEEKAVKKLNDLILGPFKEKLLEIERSLHLIKSPDREQALSLCKELIAEIE